MQTMPTQLEGLWIINEDGVSTSGSLHIPAKPLYDWRGAHEAYCGFVGEAGLYLDDAYALSDADFCVACAAAQRNQRAIIAGLKTINVADAISEMSTSGIPVTLVTSTTVFSVSPDRLYD